MSFPTDTSVDSTVDKVRPPACSGRFYPDDEDRLAAAVDRFLEVDVDVNTCPRAVIGPHAGYQFSGPTAGYAYRPLVDHPRDFRRVVVAGPSHFVRFQGIATSPAEAFRTPLGEVAVDRDAIDELLGEFDLKIDAEPHAREHSVETHLPFLQRILDDFELIPLVTGIDEPKMLQPIFERFWGDDATLVAVSTDLSHFLDYDTARDVDEKTRRAVEALRPNEIGPDDACGHVSLLALLETASKQEASAVTLDMRNSGDGPGDRNRVVGYGAWAVG